MSIVYDTPITQRKTLLHETTERLQRCAAHVRFIDDMWNEHIDALQRPNLAFPDRSSVLENNQLAVVHNILIVVDFWDTLYMSFRARLHQRSLAAI